MHHKSFFGVIFVAVLGIQSIGLAEVQSIAEPLLPEANTETLKEEIKIQETQATNLYPTAVLSRPFTLPSNAFEATLKLKTGSHGPKDNSFYSLNYLSLGYGVTNDFEMGLSWNGLKASNLTFDNLEADSSISLNMGYFLYAIPYVAAMASLSLPFHFDKEVIKTTSFAMPTSISVLKGKLAFLTFYYNTIAMHWRDNGNKKAYTADFYFPIKLNYQATSSFIASIETLLGTLSTDGKHSHIGQETPLYLNATYAITNAFDLSAKAGFGDVQDWRNSFSFVAGVSYRFGALNG